MSGIGMVVLLFLAGVALIVKGGDWFLDGAVWMAEATGVPKFIIGATIVSMGTTLPELTVSVTGVLQGEVDLAVGNAVGSVTANLGLILGLSVLCMPSGVDRRSFCFKAGMMLASAAALWWFCREGRLSLWAGFILFAAFLCGLFKDLAAARSQIRDSAKRPASSPGEWRKKLARFGAGLAAIGIGARLLIDHGSNLALALGVPTGIIGVTMVAVGTSLPELVTTLTAIARRESAMSVGNVIGANVLNLAMILPVCSAVSGGRLTLSAQAVEMDIPVCLLFCALAVLPPMARGRFFRWQGAALLALYAGYVGKLML